MLGETNKQTNHEPRVRRHELTRGATRAALQRPRERAWDCPQTPSGRSGRARPRAGSPPQPRAAARSGTGRHAGCARAAHHCSARSRQVSAARIPRTPHGSAPPGTAPHGSAPSRAAPHSRTRSAPGAASPAPPLPRATRKRPRLAGPPPRQGALPAPRGRSRWAGRGAGP